MAQQARRDESAEVADRRRRTRRLTLRLALFAVAVYIVFIVAMVNRGP
jgi:uncharacterized membrane protein (DUF485 family)